MCPSGLKSPRLCPPLHLSPPTGRQPALTNWPRGLTPRGGFLIDPSANEWGNGGAEQLLRSSIIRAASPLSAIDCVKVFSPEASGPLWFRLRWIEGWITGQKKRFNESSLEMAPNVDFFLWAPSCTFPFVSRANENRREKGKKRTL